MQPLMISSPGATSLAAFAGQGARIQIRHPFCDNAVDGYLFAGLDDDDAADFHFVRIDLFQLAVSFYIGVIGADIHKLADVAAALADGVALEEFADLIKEHDATASV